MINAALLSVLAVPEDFPVPDDEFPDRAKTFPVTGGTGKLPQGNKFA
ncbi:MAG TPA: hypothetical protein VKP67_16380 [Xanthobacteraceae bacterium]|nr:hypothetical protein [Xanthobacteraceae bacterium]